MLEAVEGEVCLLETPGMMRRVRLCMLEAVEGALYLLEMLEAMRNVLLCMMRLWRVDSVCWRCGRCWRCRK